MNNCKILLKALAIAIVTLALANCSGGSSSPVGGHGDDTNMSDGAGNGNGGSGNGGDGTGTGGDNNETDGGGDGTGTGGDNNETDGGGDGTGTGGDNNETTSDDEFLKTEYKGLVFYHKNLSPAEYVLNQLTNDEFNSLDNGNKLKVANKLLNTLFFGYPVKSLKAKINNGNFLDSVRSGLDSEVINKELLEDRILDSSYFGQYQEEWYVPQTITILTRFYAMQNLDKYFLENWIAYILTQTIMFSPAYELSSSHTPNIASVYNRLVTMLENESGMRFITYVHMMSEDNWRRFRSPEDNGREMLEIYLLDANDSHVPLAGRALKNWKLNTTSDTLEVGLNRNAQPIDLFGTTIYTGEDFYRELAKSDAFTSGVVKRLVSFFFSEKTAYSKDQITNAIVASKPETWQDILLQIIFSEEYLLHNSRAQSAEETFYSLAKKINYNNFKGTFYSLKNNLEEMHQASMKYKLGKIKRVPLDLLSFAHYHKYIRETTMVRRSNPDQENIESWDHQGWSDSFISPDKFNCDENNATESLKNLVNLIFESAIARKATTQEQEMFREHMMETNNGNEVLSWEFNMFVHNDDPIVEVKDRATLRGNIGTIVLDYISRLSETYRQREVN